MQDIKDCQNELTAHHQIHFRKKACALIEDKARTLDRADKAQIPRCLWSLSLHDYRVRIMGDLLITGTSEGGVLSQRKELHLLTLSLKA